MNWSFCGLAFAVAFALPGTSHSALVDRGGGLLYDTVLDVTWLQDANYAKTLFQTSGGAQGVVDGTMDWLSALAFADSLHYYDSVRGTYWNDWRLPTVAPINGASWQNVWSNTGSTDLGYNITSPNSELAYMFYVNLALAAGVDIPNTTLLERGGVSVHNFENKWYWFDTEYNLTPETHAFDFLGAGGAQSASLKTSFPTHLAWAVRDGDVAAGQVVPEPGAIPLVLAALGALLGVRRNRTPTKR